MKEIAIGITAIALAICFVVSIFFGIGVGYQHYRLWKVEYSGKAVEIERRYQGKAILAEAESAKQARIETAKAERDSAELTAEAIRIVGEAAKQYPEYRTQEFIMAFGEALREGRINQIMYIPTESNIPITEAGRH